MNASVLTNFDGAKNIGTPFEIACNYCNTRPTAKKKKNIIQHSYQKKSDAAHHSPTYTRWRQFREYPAVLVLVPINWNSYNYAVFCCIYR